MNGQNEWPCPTCKGTGQFPNPKLTATLAREKCPTCKGKKVVTLTEYDAELARIDVQAALSDKQLGWGRS